MEKHWQTLKGGLGLLDASLDEAGLFSGVDAQHVRFLRESRLAAPLSGFIGIVGEHDGHVDVLTELRHSFTADPLCACISRVRGSSARAAENLPAYAAPRGLADADLAHTKLAMDEVEEYGFRVIGMGVAQPGECQSTGALSMHNYMARISDSMPHLWNDLHTLGDSVVLDEEDESEGGAILEYRLRYHQPLCQGERYVLMSGLAGVGAKVQNFAHLLFNADTGALCVSAAAAGVRMDLLARQAKTLSQQHRDQLTERLIKPVR